MGAGSSTEQRSPEQPQAENDTPTELEVGDPSAEATPDTAGDPAVADADPATKLLQKNGQLSTVNGLTEQADVVLQEGSLDVQEEEVIVTDVGQRESEDVREREPDKEMAAKPAVAEDITKDGQEETPEAIEQIPSSESNLEEMTPPADSQASDVGFKKVFKFVGFKFTVKKDKTEKSDAVQLLTVKKDESEGTEGSIGAGDHQEPGVESGAPGGREGAPPQSPGKQSPGKPEDTPKPEPGGTEIPPPAESGQVTEEGGEEGEGKREREPVARSPESPSSPVTTETTSSFKKFFTQGWAGWRKKTSFRKAKEDELEASEKKKEQEPEKVAEENEEAEGGSERPPAWEQQAQEPEAAAEQARLSADYEKVELPLEEQGLQGASEDRCAPLASEVFDDKIEVQEVVAEVHASTGEKKTEEREAGVEEAAESLHPEQLAQANVEPQEDAGEPGTTEGDHTQPTDLSPGEKALPKHPEGLVSEAEMLSSQERIKVQGSPLKKLFTSTSLKKLSGKKQKGKRGGDEEPGEHPQVPAESPESDEQKGDSSASSPEEPEEITCLEKGMAEGPQEGEVEEGAPSDGEKKREGITPWASFKKMVTPKKRVRRPSESDKEEEVDKVKSATLSSTESATSEMQEEVKGVGDEQKPEEPKRKVDTSVSWEALICVGSSKKRARKASSSDDEGGPRTMTGGEGHKAEDAGKDKETGPDTIPASSQEQDQGQGSSSPEPAGSPSEGEGVSTWESFKRLVTPRKKSKTKLEEKIEDTGVEHLASDVEPGREESWVSIKKFIPGRRKKRSDGKQEQATAEDAGPADINEDDSEVPAVVPLSEYDAVEREKMEAQKSAEPSEQLMPVYVSEELSKSLVHTVNMAIIDGTRAVTCVEERSPSWISTSVTEPLEQAEDGATPSKVTEREIIAQEAPMVTQTLPETREARDDAVVSEVELTSEALTAAETSEALGAEEVTEASGAEETTDMVSAVSQLSDSPDTTEEATPVQEVEGGVPDVEEQERRTQAILQAVAEKVKEDPGVPDASGQADEIQTTQKAGPKVLERVEEAEEDPEALGLEKDIDRDIVLKVPMGETNAEPFTQGSVIVQTTEVPEVIASVESRELVTTLQAEEALGGVKPQEQAMPPDSAKTLTDSETNRSTPIAGLEVVGTVQQDEATESHDITVVTGAQAKVTEAEAASAQKEGPPAASCQSQEENEEPPRAEDVLEHTEQELSVEADVPILCKPEMVQEAGQFADGEVKDILCVKGLEVSAHPEGTGSQEMIAKVALEGKMSEGAECQKSESVELQSASPEKREMGTDMKPEAKPEQVSEEAEQKAAPPVCKELSQPLVQTVELLGSERGKEVSLLEGSSPHSEQQEVTSTEVQVQSFDTVEKVLETTKIPETGEALQSAGAYLITAEKSSEEGEDGTPQARDKAVPMGPESQEESISTVASATPENVLLADLEIERSTSQKQRSDEEDEQVGQEGRVSTARKGDLKAETEILELVTESSKLVQNIIQTAVDQFAHTEEMATEVCAPDLQMQAPLMQADCQGAEQTLEKEESQHPAWIQDEALTTTAQEVPQLDAMRPALSDVSEASAKMVTVEVESSIVNDEQFGEMIAPSEAEGDGSGTKPVPADGHTKLGERVEKPPFEPKEDEKGDAAVGPEHQSPVLAHADTLRGLTKESPDTNGPKLTEEGDAPVGIQEAKAPSESDKESKLKTEEEDLQKPQEELTESELTES